MKHPLDDYLLELILLDSFVSASSRPIAGAEDIIQSYLPAGLYERVIERYDVLSEAWDESEAILPLVWQRRAVRKGSTWKSMMIIRCLRLLCAGGCCDAAGLAEVLTFAQNIGAAPECRRVLACLAFVQASLPRSASEARFSTPQKRH